MSYLSAPYQLARSPGQAERSGPLAFGHANILRAVTVDDDQTRDILAMVFAAPPGPPRRVVDLVGVLLERHESLRTRYRFKPIVTQHVAATGELVVEVVEAGTDPFGTAVATARRLRVRPFDFEAAPPLRAAVVTQDGVAQYLVWVVSHVAMDAAACEILLREWTALASGRPLPPAGPQPLDVVELERTPPVRRLTSGATKYWASRMRHVPQAMFPLSARVTATRDDWHPGLRIRSRTAMTHLADIAARTSASHSVIMLAAVNAIVCHYTGQSTCVTTSLSGNRVLRRLRDFFGSLSQDALLSVPVPETGTFDELVRDVRAAALAAYRAGWFDPAEVWSAITEASAQRGICYARDLVFNDMSQLSSGADFVTASAQSRLPAVWLPGEDDLTVNESDVDASLRPQPAENIPCRLVVYVYRLDTELDVILHVDPACMDAGELAEFGRFLLRLLRAAAESDVPVKDLPALTTLTPLTYGEGWFLVDSCWVEIDAVRDLLAEVLGDRPHFVSVLPDQRIGHRVTCHLAGPADIEDIHRRCVAALPGRVTVVAPHEYVVCAEVPPDPNGWATAPVIARGDGRPAGSGLE
ncbi:condensation domain-containing protein [Actinocrispum wychmicini]|uniref:Condensation domain-containing protein n=1 Tax=Actinocrispum wychmicini TaxID=1213861 RepID=A0A4R2IIN1_9PSEU|nr:condensation domain-containing protein [Actinocrispum wychmicini]TCO44784.1 condensation domain-containing protein [Actinocrispum wychmicini]